MATNTNILFPQTPFIDPSTGRPSLPWVLWLQNPSFVSASYANALAISSGGTGISTAPTNGQLLIGNAGNYTLHTLSTGSGIGISNGAGLITIANTGVLSNAAGTGISVSNSTGNVTIANTGVLSFSGGSTGLTPATATTGAVSLAGTLAVAYGGTGQTTYTNGQLLIGNTTGNTLAKSTLTAGTGISITNGAGSITVTNTSPSSGGTVTSVSVVSANGLAGTVATATTTPAITLSTTVTGLLKGNGTAISAATSGTDYAPATSGTSILYGNGSGGFSNVTIGSGISFTTGTLSATGSGGTVTSVGLSLPSIFTVSGSPVTGTGTLTGTFNTQTANYVFAGPTTGSAATPTFRALVSADIPNNAANTTGYASNIAGGLAGSIPYQTAVNATSLLGIGTTGQILRVVSGLPSWGTDYVGTVTSVSALTLGTTGTDLSSTVATGTTTPVITLNVPTASASNRGALSSTDWTTFNNKGSGSVTSVSGTGTVNGITLTGTVTSSGSLTLGGTLGSIANSQLSNSTISGVSLGSNLFSLTAGTGVSFSAGTTYNGSAAITITATGSGGTVTSVTGTAPVVSSGGTTPAISMAAATTSVNGYLTSTDWTTFNGKQAALVSGTNIKTVNGTTLLGSGDVGTITYAYGGTGQTTVTTGDVLYGSATNTWSKLGIGTTGQILRVVAGAPAWGTDYVGTVTSVGGTGTVNGITLTGTVTSFGNLTLGGTLSGVSLTTQVSGILPVANGGTNASTASITSFNNITGYTASGATGTTSTNLVFSTSPSITTPTLAGDVNLSTGNITQGTAAKGINFTANTPASGMTSQLLNWYEEGTWTPVMTFSTPGDLSVTYTTQVGWYTRNGSLVTAFFRVIAATFVYTTATGNFTISGLPFTSNATSQWYGVGPVIVSGINLTAYAATTKYANTRTAPNTSTILILLSGDSQASAYAASQLNVPTVGSPNAPNLTGSVTYRV